MNAAMKTFVFVIVIVNAVSSTFAQTLGEQDLDVPPDELAGDIEQSDRSASGQVAGASVPAGSRLMPGFIGGHACYVCTNCPKVLPNTTYKACPYSADSTKNNKCVVYSEQYRPMNKPWYIRGCASERGSCQDISRTHSLHEDIVKLNFCVECEGDKCNVSGGERPPATFAAFFILVVTPLLSKQALS